MKKWSILTSHNDSNQIWCLRSFQPLLAKKQNLSKCTKLCFTDKLEVADKYFGLLTENYLMYWQLRELKDDISGNIWVVCILESLNSDFACVSRCKHAIFLQVGRL